MIAVVIKLEEEQIGSAGGMLADHILVVGKVGCPGPEGDGEVVGQIQIGRVDVAVEAVEVKGAAIGQLEAGGNRAVDLGVAVEGAVGLGFGHVGRVILPNFVEAPMGDEPVIPTSSAAVRLPQAY